MGSASLSSFASKQILFVLDVVPVKVQRFGGAHRRNLRQGTQCESMADQLVV